MIEDFTNPHGELKPTRVVTTLPDEQEIRIVRLQGMYYVEYLETKLTTGRTDHVSKNWVLCKIQWHGKPPIFQTLHEAENYMQRLKSETIEYYY